MKVKNGKNKKNKKNTRKQKCGKEKEKQVKVTGNINTQNLI